MMIADRPLISVGIAIVNWNSGTQLTDCLASVSRSEYSNFSLSDVVVVDNGSTDRSVNDLRAFGLPVTILRNRENLGFAKAANQAAAHLQTDYVLFLNPDCRVSPDAIRIALAALIEGQQSVGVVGVRLVTEDGLTSRHCSRRPTPSTFWRLIFGLHRLRPGYGLVMDDWDHTQSRNVDHVMGAFYLMPLSLLRAVNGFDERFFVYLEDLDLSLRVTGAGRTIRYVAEAEVFHAGGGSSRQDKGARMAYMLESRIRFCFKHFSRGHAVALTFGTLLIEPPIRVLASLSTGAPHEIPDTCRGMFVLFRRFLERRPSRPSPIPSHK